MTLDFASLKKNSKQGFGELLEKLDKMNTNKYESDDRFWYPEQDKAGNAYAVIRFLPAPQGEDLPLIKKYEHSFQGPGGWYINDSLTTIGKDDPVTDYNTTLWDTGIESQRELVRKHYKRKLTYVSNILIVSYAAKPELEGQVKLFKYGRTIYEKLDQKMHPTFPGEQPMIPFDPWTGANFALKIRKKDGFNNYDLSEFQAPAPIGSDEEIEKIWMAEHSLQGLLDPKLFKSYEELSARLKKVLGLGDTDVKNASVVKNDEPAPRQEAAEHKSVESDSAPSTSSQSDESDDDGLEYFKSLVD